jgi:hypothetical protein
MSTDALIKERAATHGDFEQDAFVAQTIKNVVYSIHEAHSRHHLSDAQCQAIDMIASKLGRIAAGDCNIRDHWDDIAGYARLVAKTLPGGNEPAVYPIATGLSGRLVTILQAVIPPENKVEGAQLVLRHSPGVDHDADSYDLSLVVTG